MKEIWKNIPGYENRYQVSNLGRVKKIACSIIYKNGHVSRYKEKVLSPETTKGYRRVTLSINNNQKRFQVHRLVAMAFIKNEHNKPCVNHIDGDKINNNVKNLEWCTYSENERHSYDVLNKVNNNRKLSNNDVNYIRSSSKSPTVLSKMFGVHRDTIYNVLNRKYYV